MKCIELALPAEIRIPSFHILLCRYYMICWNETMKETLNQEKIDTKELSTLIRDMQRMKHYLSSYAVNVLSIILNYNNSSLFNLKMLRKLQRLLIVLLIGMLLFDKLFLVSNIL